MDLIFSGVTRRIVAQVMVIGVALGVATSHAQADSSGAYISRFTNAVELLQLVETPDHRITGQLQAVIHTGDGNVENDSYVVSGAADGLNVTLMLKLNALLSNPVTESGTFDGSKLELTGQLAGGQPRTLIFAKSTPAEFLAAADAIRAQAGRARLQKAMIEAQQRQEKQRQDFISATNQLIARIQHFEAASDALLPKLPKMAQRYHAISSNMYAYYNRERTLAGNPAAGLARSQIALTISQASLATDQIHNQVQLTQWDFENNIVPVANQVNAAVQTCTQVHPSTHENPLASTDTEVNSVCMQLKGMENGFWSEYDAAKKALANVEAVYRQEHKYQQGLVEASSRID